MLLARMHQLEVVLLNWSNGSVSIGPDRMNPVAAALGPTARAPLPVCHRRCTCSLDGTSPVGPKAEGSVCWRNNQKEWRGRPLVSIAKPPVTLDLACFYLKRLTRWTHVWQPLPGLDFHSGRMETDTLNLQAEVPQGTDAGPLFLPSLGRGCTQSRLTPPLAARTPGGGAKCTHLLPGHI